MDATVLKRSTLSAVSTHPQAQLFIHTSSRCSPSRYGYFADVALSLFFTHVCNLVLIDRSWRLCVSIAARAGICRGC
jgi:hypothetical protein